MPEEASSACKQKPFHQRIWNWLDNREKEKTYKEMHDPISKPQPVMGELCPYHWMSIPARNGTSTRTNGASFQKNIAECVCISELFKSVPYASTGIRGKDKKTTRSILKRTRRMAKKIKQAVSGKDPGMGLGQKKFPQVFVENKGLEEICRRVFTGILDS